MEESRVKNTSKNIIYAFIFEVIKILLVFIGRIVFVKKLGVAYLGINGLFSNILGVLSLADLGMATVLMYALYEPLAKKDEIKIKKYMNYFKKIYNIIALTVTIIGISLIPFLKYLVNLPDNMPDIYVYYILLLLNTVISYLFVYKTTLVSADQKMYLLNKYDIIFQFILFVMQLAILIFTSNFALYLGANVVCSLISNIIKVKCTEKIYPFLKNKDHLELDLNEKKTIFNNLKSLFLYKIGGVIQNNTDNILISVMVGTIVVGYYANYSTIILSITTFITMVFSSLKASMGNFVVNENKSSQLKMFNILEIYNFWLVGFCTICFLILIPDFISICFGKEYVLGIGLLICACLNFYTSNIRQTIWTYRETTGIFQKTKYITIVTSIINIILSVILGYYFGLEGIIGATVIARLIYAWWKEPQILFKNYFKESPKNYYVNYIKRILLLIIIFIIINSVCNLLYINNVYMLFIFKALMCISITFLVFYALYRRSDAVIYLKENILPKLKGKQANG